MASKDNLHSHLRSSVSPCGTHCWYEVHHDPKMNHRELRAMWRELAEIAANYDEMLTRFIERDEAHTYSI